MKGIVLAGGSGTRLYPITMVTSKQLLPIYDKPMIYYPLSTLMLAGIKDILIITTPHDIGNFKKLLDDGSHLGIKLSYIVQPSPDGLAQAFVLGKDFVADEPSAMILGDNIFYGGGLVKRLEKARINAECGQATVFGYYVDNPSDFGIVEFDKDWRVVSVEEKPVHPKSNYCITGLYFYPKGVSERAMSVKKSTRGEYEITSLNETYLQDKLLNVEILGRGFTWFDTGTVGNLLEASQFVSTVERLQGIKISAPEEIAYRNGWITKKQLLESAEKYGKSAYGKHLFNVANGKIVY